MITVDLRAALEQHAAACRAALEAGAARPDLPEHLRYLAGADLGGANLRGADLGGANFLGRVARWRRLPTHLRAPLPGRSRGEAVTALAILVLVAMPFAFDWLVDAVCRDIASGGDDDPPKEKP